MIDCPCYQCDRRTVGCHSCCPDYYVYRTRMTNRSNYIKNAKKEEQKMNDYYYEALRKRKW